MSMLSPQRAQRSQRKIEPLLCVLRVLCGEILSSTRTVKAGSRDGKEQFMRRVVAVGLCVLLAGCAAAPEPRAPAPPLISAPRSSENRRAQFARAHAAVAAQRYAEAAAELEPLCATY